LAVIFFCFAAALLAFVVADDFTAIVDFFAVGLVAAAALAGAGGSKIMFGALGLGDAVHCHLPATSAHAWPSLAAP
jgi:hypothetical protein